MYTDLTLSATVDTGFETPSRRLQRSERMVTVALIAVKITIGIINYH